MKIDFGNYTQFIHNDNEESLLYSLLLDLEELNNNLHDQNLDHKKIYIDCQDYHDQYSPERTDPCPDFYGMFTIRFEGDKTEYLGYPMKLDDLDYALSILCNFVEFDKQ